MTKKTFILGLGHQKCGTTWLFEYLKLSPTFVAPFAKELHIWDQQDIPFLFQNTNKYPTKRPMFLLGNSQRVLRSKMFDSEEFYFDYFYSLYRAGAQISCDLTPEYCGLGSSRLCKIRDSFQKRGIRVKVAILIRDPLARIKSSVRSNLDRSNYNEGIRDQEKNFDEAINQYHCSEHCVMRTRYPNIILRAREVFDHDDIFIGVYETLFQSAELRRLSNFLEIKENIKFGEVWVNQTPTKVTETEHDEKIKEYYRDVYEFSANEFPETREFWSPLAR
jgi:hypothetical protein